MPRKISEGTNRHSKEKPGVDSLILAFAPGVQLDIIARNSSNHSPEHKEFLADASRELGASVQRLSVPMAAGYRLKRGSALLLSIPVTEVEKFSGREGLSVTLTASFHGRPSIAPAVLVQLLAALDLAIADVCNVPYENPAATALALTQSLQHDDNDEFRRDLSAVTERISGLFSQLLLHPSSSWLVKMLPGYQVGINGSTFNYCQEEIHFALCQLVMEQVQLTKRTQMGYYSKAGSLSLESDIMIGGHRFVNKGIVISSSIR